MSLKKDTVWATLDTFVNQCLTFGFRLVLARMLAPEAFGVLSMANATMAVLQMVNDFGISSTLIQRKKEEMTPTFLAAAFTAALAISLALFVVNAAVIAPFSGIFFKTSEVSGLVAFLGIAFLFTPFTTISQALLLKDRRFNTVAKLRCIALLCGLAVGSVILGLFHSIWALPVQVIVTQLITMVLFYGSLKWPIRLSWDAGARRELFGFSGVVFLNNLLVACFKNIDQIILGRLFPPAQLGLYSFAVYLTDTVRTSLMSIMNRVMFVHYSEHQDNPEKLRADYLRTLFWNCTMLFPPMLVICMVGPELVTLVMGAKWQGLDPVLRILALTVIVHAAGGTTSTLFVAIGKPKLDLNIFVFTSVAFTLPGIFLGAKLGGITGVALGVLISRFLAGAVRQIALRKVLHLPFAPYLRVLGRAALEVMPMIVIFLVFRSLGGTANLVAVICFAAIASATYGGLFLNRFIRNKSF